VTLVADVPLRGAGGEPVDFARTIASHGVAELPPKRLDLEARVLETTLPAPGGARTVRLTNGRLRIEGVAGRVGVRARDKLAKTVSHLFRLDEELSDFYELVNEDELAWCALGAGRMLRAPTVFEDVIKTYCTSATTAELRPAASVGSGR
jgi:3-methyladenine DNA glycosylase/8-oxoguanine DNA glycosylase